jgi:hypothetical protein
MPLRSKVINCYAALYHNGLEEKSANYVRCLLRLQLHRAHAAPIALED